MTRPISLEERLNRHLDKSGDCWLWTGRLCWNGYGHVKLGNTVARALALSVCFGPGVTARSGPTF